MRTLKVINVEACKDKNDKAYNKIELSTPDFLMQSGQRIRIEPKTQNIIKYPESYLPGGDPQYGHDMKLGEVVAGDIVTLSELMPYNIVDPSGNVTRQATSASHVVLANSDDEGAFDVATQREFRSRGKFADDGTNDEAYAKFWGFLPETGEVIESETEATVEATL